jgi:NADH-quinone oxidoreductase subunit C/D
MEKIKDILNKYDMEFVEDYKKTWVKAKLKNKEDLLNVVKDLKEEGVNTCSTWIIIIQYFSIQIFIS